MARHATGRWSLDRCCLAVIAGMLLLAFGVPVASATTLPDGRAWEMVSPTDKNNTGVNLGNGSTVASESGERVAFDVSSGFEPSEGSGRAGTATFLATRTAADWLVQGLTPLQAVDPLATVTGSVVLGFSGDLSKDVLTSIGPLVPDAPDIANLYLHDTGSDTYQLLNPTTQTGLSKFFYTPIYAGASADFSHVIFESRQNFTPEATGFSIKLYEWTNGTLRVAGVLPDGTLPAEGSKAGSGAIFGNIEASAISDDGSRIFFSDSPNENSGALYMRENGTTTTWISQSEASSPDPTPQPAVFQDATPDGSKVLFTTTESLVDEDPGPSGDPASTDLYMYDVDAPAGAHLTLLSTDGVLADGSDVRGVAAISADGSYVYFGAAGTLVAGQPPVDPSNAGLYLWHDGEVRFVTRLGDPYFVFDGRNWNQSYIFSPRTARATADGRRLLYSSRAPQPGSPDNAGHQQLYLYDADSDAIACVSCNPSGAPATSDADVTFGQQGVPNRPYLPRALSADGRRVFFHTSDALVAEDTNGVRDVYAWEDGTVHLLSSGTAPHAAYFADASVSGDDVFFATAARLSGWDRDDVLDLYDARVGGGQPEPAAPGATCIGDDCQGEPSRAASLPRPGSATFIGGSGAAGRTLVFKVRPITAKQRRTWARTGRLTLRVRVYQAGKVSAAVRTRLGRIARASRVAGKPGTVRLRLISSRTARSALAHDGRLRVTVVVRHSKARAPQRASLTLRAARGGQR